MRYIAIIARLGFAAFVSVACSSEAGGGPGTIAGAAGAFSAGGASGGSPVGGSGASTAGAGGSALPPGGSSSGGAATTVGNWHNVTANLANMASECGNLTMVQAQPGSDMVVAGVAQKGLWATHDGGATWAALGTGAGSAVITNRMSAIVWDPDHPGTFWESGIYNGGGVYKTVDNGVTFTQLGNSFHNDSVSVDLTDPDRKTLLAGGHETPKKLLLSTDAGATWTDIGPALPDNSGSCTATVVLDAKTFLVGCSGSASAVGIYRSTNSGASWSRVGMTAVWPVPLLAPGSAIYFVAAAGGIQKSADSGLSFAQVADANTAPFLISPTSLVALPDGRIVAVGKDHLQASADDGVTWKPIADPLPVTGGGYDGISGVTYSLQTKTFFIWHWTCHDPVPEDAIWSFHFDYEIQ